MQAEKPQHWKSTCMWYQTLVGSCVPELGPATIRISSNSLNVANVGRSGTQLLIEEIISLCCFLCLAGKRMSHLV